ncbi:MAG: SDR family oxidoreductase [Bacteroidia bacterium]|nr:SDR family oxidoreductase [Bacteroidia bacterium]MCF8445936.1 SDR family oxidoreductase [Bacteroidia bacterium]
MRLNGKIALITGANKGIGLAITQRFLGEGAIVYAGIKNVAEASSDLNILKTKFDSQLNIIKLNVTESENCKEVFQQIKKSCDKIDVLVNNAGIVSYELVPFIDFEKLQLMIQTNVVGLIKMCQLASRYMARQKSGSIINISSIVSLKGASGQAAYSATKGAVNSFTLSLAKELANSNIRVNAIAPGMVSTERLKQISQEKFGDKVSQIGFGRMASPDEIADICLFFASDESSYVTGQLLGADGSLTI